MSKKYSDWFKVDLHIHTDKSNLTKTNDYDGNFDLAILKAKLIQNGVKLFSLTDHNIINIDAYKTYYEEKNDFDPILLVGVEFDIKVTQDDNSHLTYHTLLIFNENTVRKVEELSELIENHYQQENIALKDRYLTEDQIFELFNNYHFFYIPHAGGHKNIIDAYKGTDIRKIQEMVLLMECAHEKVKEKHRQRHKEGFDKLKDTDFRNREDEAFINFSDNHNCNVYPTPKSGAIHEFYCLKGEPTFETIRFAFIDPKSRIRKQSEVDALKNVKKHIAELDIQNIANVDDCKLELSPNLNVIIGGASSGKSLLFNLIGKKIHSTKHTFDTYKKDESTVTIKASNSHIFQQDLPFNSDEVVYINQGDIVKYFEKGDLNELVVDSGKEEELAEAKHKISLRKKHFDDSLESFRNQFDKLNTSYHKDFAIRDGDLKNMLSDKFHFVDVSDNINYDDLQIREIILNRIKIDSEDFKTDTIYSFTETENKVIEEFQTLVLLKFSFLKKKKEIQNQIKIFLQKIRTSIRTKNNTLDSSSRAKSEAFKRKSSLLDTCSNLFSEASKFNKYAKELGDYDYSVKQQINIDDLVKLVLEIEKDEDLSKGVSSCINDSKADESIYLNYLSLVQDNNRLKDYAEYTDVRLLQKIRKENSLILDKFDNPNTYLDYGDNGNSKNKSPGYNAEMYLKTILQQDNCNLIMIDQPEDNLGNTFKNEALINILREFKFKKQLILVTHNPSIVVYGDAENIIIADNDKGQISYQQLVLERKESQKKIIDNLDGGKAIFDMRSRKYNIKKLLNS